MHRCDACARPTTSVDDPCALYAQYCVPGVLVVCPVCAEKGGRAVQRLARKGASHEAIVNAGRAALIRVQRSWITRLRRWFAMRKEAPNAD